MNEGSLTNSAILSTKHKYEKKQFEQSLTDLQKLRHKHRIYNIVIISTGQCESVHFLKENALI